MNKPFDSDGMLTAGFQFKYKGTEVLSQAITIGVLPASNVLYEENFLTKGDPSSSDWQKVESDQPLGNQQPQKVTTDEELLKGYSVFGYDTAYADKANQLGVWSVDSLEAGKGLSSALTTEFYGKGFDLIGNCGPDTGRVLLLLTNKETNKGMLLDIDTRYNDGTGEYGETTLHQVPLAHVMLDEEATYKAAIYAGGKLETTVSTQYAAMPVASYDTDLYSVLAENGLTMADVEYVKVSGAEAASAAASTNGIAVYSAPAAYAAADTTVKHKAGTHVEIDGFRVYRSSTDNINYPESERNVTYWNILDVVKDEIVAYREGEGTASASVSVKDYEKTGGPQNEIYLKPGQSVAFKLKGSSIMSVQVSLRAVDGVSSWNDNTISSNTEMYYTLDKDSNDNFVISVPESTTDMLAIGNVKLLNSVTADDIVAADGIETEELLMSIRMAMSAASVEPDQPEPSLEFVPEYVSIRDYATPLFRSKLVTLRIDFSSDVSYVTIDGVRYDPSRLASWFGYHTVTFTDRISRNADYFYKIVFFDADGNPSETHVVQGK